MRKLIRCLVWCGHVLFIEIALADESIPAAENRGGVRAVAALFQEHCALCHGTDLQGATLGTALVGTELNHGDQVTNLINSISSGFAEKGMPAWGDVLDEQEIKGLALWIAEVRDNITMADFRLSQDIQVPSTILNSELHNLRLEVIAQGLDPLPYSIAPLANGDILLTEKMRGLRLIKADGTVGELITGTPRVYDDVPRANSLDWGLGRMLEVKPHPDYATNGWIYLHYTERCEDCNAFSREHQQPVSMNALVRGRIDRGEWVDEEIIYRAPFEFYTRGTDLAAGGRIAFDPDGYVFISVGDRGGAQDLRRPDGKMHRLHDDGRIPRDNPFANQANALPSIWSYGHRSPQGLEFNPKTAELWGSEHGPRGGDEVNLLLPGKNYGWPAFSLGQNYNGTEVNRGREALELELEDIEQPIVDLTPSPAISSFVIYEGHAFPEWSDDLIVSSLKAADLYRIRLRDNQVVTQEVLIDNLARIRDVEINAKGEILLLLAHTAGGKIVKLMPADPREIATRQ